MINTWVTMLEGDKDAFMTLYHSEFQALFSYGFTICADREIAKDCIQELFFEIWNTRLSLNKEVNNVRSYLFTWLRRKIMRELAHTEKERSSVSRYDEFFFSEPSYEELLIAFQQSEEKKAALAMAVKKLTKKQLEIVRLRFIENLSYAEIATQTALAPRTVYNLVYEAIRHLKLKMRHSIVVGSLIAYSLC